MIEAPPRAKADSPCSKVFGPVAICVLGDFNFETDKLEWAARERWSISGSAIRGSRFSGVGMPGSQSTVFAARNATVVGNRITGNASGIVFVKSVNTTIAKNHEIGNPSNT